MEYTARILSRHMKIGNVGFLITDEGELWKLCKKKGDRNGGILFGVPAGPLEAHSLSVLVAPDQNIYVVRKSLLPEENSQGECNG